MSSAAKSKRREKQLRLVIFAAVAALHGILILFVTFQMETAGYRNESPPQILQLFEIEELAPPLPPPPMPPPPLEEELPPQSDVLEIAADNIVEIDEELFTPPMPSSTATAASTGTTRTTQGAAQGTEFLRPHMVTVQPVLPEAEILRSIIYPPIARRAGIEGVVFLELFIDREGIVRDVRVLREDPPGRGFGEEAVRVFRGVRGTPAEADGEPVAVRFRYNLRFTLR